jgi:uncharacterized DUF497 family protein
MGELLFDWDEEKRSVNIKKHDVDFFDAALIFENQIIEDIDKSTNYGEERYRAIGISRDVVLCVVYTWRGEDIIRIISAWRANKNDTERYYKEIYP